MEFRIRITNIRVTEVTGPILPVASIKVSGT